MQPKASCLDGLLKSEGQYEGGTAEGDPVHNLSIKTQELEGTETQGHPWLPSLKLVWASEASLKK